MADIGGTDFLHFWVADSIWLECAESLITISDSFYGGLFRVLASFIAVLPVNNSLIHCVRPASSWPHDSLS